MALGASAALRLVQSGSMERVEGDRCPVSLAACSCQVHHVPQVLLPSRSIVHAKISGDAVRVVAEVVAFRLVELDFFPMLTSALRMYLQSN